jgi:hypothetical protein
LIILSVACIIPMTLESLILFILQRTQNYTLVAKAKANFYSIGTMLYTTRGVIYNHNTFIVQATEFCRPD